MATPASGNTAWSGCRFPRAQRTSGTWASTSTNGGASLLAMRSAGSR
ncbi:MAG TPA: hypothetical protein VH482_20825 [Thermomicrobiales bacterium]